LVAIEHRIAQVFDVHGDAEADHEHQEQRTAQRQGGAHRIALQFQCFAPQIAEHAAQAEAFSVVPDVLSVCRWRLNRRIGGLGGAGGSDRAALRLDEVADEGLFEGFSAALLDQLGGHVAVEHLARMHH